MSFKIIIKSNIPILSTSNERIDQSEKLEEIDALFFDECHPSQYVVLLNTESNGKTNLAIEYSKNIFKKKQNSKSIIKWINGSLSENIVNIYKI